MISRGSRIQPKVLGKNAGNVRVQLDAVMFHSESSHLSIVINLLEGVDRMDASLTEHALHYHHLILHTCVRGSRRGVPDPCLRG